MALELEHLFMSSARGPRVDFKSLSGMGPWSLNIVWNCLILQFFYPGRTGFMAQRLLWTSKGSFGLQTGLGQYGSEAAICGP